MKSPVPRFHVWVPNMFEFKGGIQTYSTFFLKAHQSLYPDSPYHVFLKHDTQAVSNLRFATNTQFHFAGRVPNSARTLAFATTLMSQGLLHKPDLILSTHLNFTSAAYWLKQVYGVHYWAVAHGIEAWNIQSLQLKRALSHADLILAVSNYTRNQLLKDPTLDPAKVVLLPNTFDAEKFQPGPKPEYLLQRYQLRLDQPIILTVSRLSKSERYKGYDQILKALPQIRSVIPNVHYVLVGKGSDRDRIENLIQQLQLEDCVTLTGFIPDNELCDHYNLCDVFAMPSKKEGFGIVYLEAMACGKPVLGGNQDGTVDALCRGELGALVNPDDCDEITQTLTEILLGHYSNPIIYDPYLLRQKVIEVFGFDRFTATLAQYCFQRSQFTLNQLARNHLK